MTTRTAGGHTVSDHHTRPCGCVFQDVDHLPFLVEPACTDQRQRTAASAELAAKVGGETPQWAQLQRLWGETLVHGGFPEAALAELWEAFGLPAEDRR